MPPLQSTEITAGRLHLRPWQPADADAVLAICQDPAVQRWTRVPVPYLREHAESYVGEVSPQAWAAGTAAHFAVLDAVSARVLASVSLMDVDERDAVAEVGFWCAADARGRGITAEAVAAVCRWGFAAVGLRRVAWYAEVGNTASRRVAQKCGFRFECVARGRLTARGGGQADAWQAALLATDDPVPRGWPV